MSRKTRILHCLAVAVSVLAAPRPAAPQTYECREVMVPMRDGVRLATDVYLPTQGTGPWPVIMERTPYDKSDCSYPHADYFAARGYAVLIQDERGRYRSEGEYYWYRIFGPDGHDAVEWAGTQPWSSGKVGTMGLSFPCVNQYAILPHDPPHLAAVFCAHAFGDPYRYIHYQGGALQMHLPGWLLTQREMAKPRPLAVGRQTAGPSVSVPDDAWFEWYRRKQEGNLSIRDAIMSDMFQDLIENPYYNDYWRELNVNEQIEKIDVPIFHYASWYDRYTDAQSRLFNAIRERGGERARESGRLQLGPWLHGGGGVRGSPAPMTNRVIGDLDFGPKASIDYNALRLRWFDYHVKGIENGIGEEPPIKIFVMGANTWRYENEFPLARTVYTDYFLRSGPSGSINSLNDGLLSSEPPSSGEPPDSYEYNPMKPLSAIGGDLHVEPMGARDHRPVDRLSLTYTTPPLEEDLEVTGWPVLEFYASSSAVDTDWVVTLSDVHPDGYSQHLRQNLLRAKFREGFERPVLMTPGQPHRFRIEMFPIANVFKEGHRIRIAIQSSSFPKWYPNQNTGRELYEEVPGVVATNTIYHDGERPARLTLPVIPRARGASESGR